MANFIANSDEDDVFKYLTPYTVYCHGKDRKVNDVAGRMYGEGDIDWVKFFRNYFKYTPDAPFIFEYVNADTTDTAVARAKQYIAEAKK